MSNVLELPATAAPSAPLLTPRSLKPLSRGLALLFAFMIGMSLFWVVASFIVTFFYSNHILVGPEGANVGFPGVPRDMPGMIRFSSQPFLTHLAGFLNICMATVPVVLICWHLRALFRLYAQGIVFARRNAMHLKRVGVWLIAWPVVKFLANAMFQLAGGTDKAWAQMIFLDALILGLIVFAIAQVMEFGHEIEQEKDSFV